ncbi:MAG: transcriptional regulator [Bdellovibrionota bacterium]
MELFQTHTLLSDRARLAILASLASSPDGRSFNELLASLELTKGNLSSHLRKLEDGQLIEVTKSFVGRKPHTSYRCSDTGRAALKQYLTAVESLLGSLKK